MKEPVEHVLRVPLPWRREDPRTECGLDAGSYPTLTVAAVQAKIKDQGQQRAAMSTCMTCWHTAERHARSHLTGDLVGLLERDLARALYNEDAELRRELAAIVMLIEAHREEFDAALASLTQAVSIDELRQARARRRG